MWQHRHDAETGASPTALWRILSDIPRWPDWEVALEGARLEGPLGEGTTGKRKPRHWPESAFTLTEVLPERVLTDSTSLPGGRMVIEHHIRPAGEGAAVSFQTTISGALSLLWGVVIGRSVRKATPESMRRLIGLAEQAQR